jgi:hypothetical protein
LVSDGYVTLVLLSRAFYAASRFCAIEARCFALPNLAVAPFGFGDPVRLERALLPPVWGLLDENQLLIVPHQDVGFAAAEDCGVLGARLSATGGVAGADWVLIGGGLNIFGPDADGCCVVPEEEDPNQSSPPFCGRFFDVRRADARARFARQDFVQPPFGMLYSSKRESA